MELVSIGQAARQIGVSPATLRKWERIGKVSPLRVANGIRLYEQSDIARLRKERRTADTQTAPRDCDSRGADDRR